MTFASEVTNSSTSIPSTSIPAENLIATERVLTQSGNDQILNQIKDNAKYVKAVTKDLKKLKTRLKYEPATAAAEFKSQDLPREIKCESPSINVHATAKLRRPFATKFAEKERFEAFRRTIDDLELDLRKQQTKFKCP